VYVRGGGAFVLENRVMGKIFVPETEEETGGSKNHTMRSFMI
jgi:hypothetical protein